MINRFLLIFLVFIMFYHLIHTFLVWKLGFDKTLISLSKDILWILFFSLVFIFNYKRFFDFIREFKYPILYFVLFSIISILLAFLDGLTLKQILIGIKYDIWPLFVLLSAGFIGFLISKYDKIDFSYKFFKIILIFLMLNLVVGLGKIFFPGFFQFIFGFGEVKNFDPFSAPPVYYTNGDGGIPRLSGLFAGPNNLGFFLVAFFPFIFYLSKKFFENNKILKVLSNLTVFILGIFTLSRGWILGILVDLFFILKKKLLKYWYLLIIGIVVVFIGLILLSGSRSLSTFEHGRLTKQGIILLKDHPWGYGIGTFGPSSFYLNKDYKEAKQFVPENTYLQIALNNGILSFVFWILFWISIIYYFVKTKKSEVYHNIRWFVLIGLFGLAVEGMFLHIFDDAMIVYLYLVILGYFLYK